MVRASDYVDPDYDRRLAEYKAEKARRARAIAEGRNPDTEN